MQGSRARGTRRPPGPRGNRLYHTHRRLSRYREFLDELNQEYGSIVFFRNVFQDCCVVFDPDLLHEMQHAQRTSSSDGQDRSRSSKPTTKTCPARHDPVFVKNHKQTDFIPGLGLNTSDGQPHRRMVRLVEPAFARERLDEYCETIVEEVLAAQANWPPGNPGNVLQAKAALTRLSTNVLFRFAVGRDLPCDPDMLMKALTGIKFDVILTVLPFSSLLKRLPFPDRLRNRRAIHAIDRVFLESMQRARDSPEGRVDAVSCMVHATDQDREGSAFSDQEVRDITWDLVMASIDPLKVTLARCLAYVAANPAVRKRLEREADEVLGDREIAASDHEELPYARAILMETLRLGPPGYSINRAIRQDYSVGDYVIPEGTFMEFCFGAAQCSEKYWDRPREFRPERWLEDSRPDRPDHVFSAFGYWPHACLGREVATRTAVYLLASTAQRYRLDPLKPLTEDLKLLYGLSGPVPMRVSERTPGFTRTMDN